MTFPEKFYALTGHEPFPWQEELYRRLISNDDNNFPSSCNIPTGLGKTNVIAIWLIAFVEGANVPRRLVYVVNRRTVVDQTTEEAIKLRNNSEKIGIHDLAISTLRGQFADNREWSADPSKPAIICGTVDMIGSRLLFSGYGCGFKTKPLHAGFLGQDVLLVHDEAHLEPAFQKLIERIRKEQDEFERTENLPWPKLRVMELTATSRSDNSDTKSGNPFELTDREKKPEEIPDPPKEPIHYVWTRLTATKTIFLDEIDDDKKVADKIAEWALKPELKDSNSTVLIFLRTIEDVTKVYEKLIDKKKGVKEEQIKQLTGTIRGKERDDLIETPLFQRFYKNDKSEPTVYLICTSAGEVGIDISADHMICDLTPFDSMAQRLGRVNRFGEPRDHKAHVYVVHPKEFGKRDKKGKLQQSEYDKSCEKTLELLRSLEGDASPLALMIKLDENEKSAAFTPSPTILPSTDILFDAWALTTIREKMPGRPPVEPYLHGIRDWEPPDTYIAWREEVEKIYTEELRERYKPEDLLEDYPLKPHELLRDRSDRVFKHLQALAKEHPSDPVWVVDNQDHIEVTTLEKLISADKSTINGVTLLLSPKTGGLMISGMLGDNKEGSSKITYDVADEWCEEDKQGQPRKRRMRIWSDAPKLESPPTGMRLIRVIDTKPDEDEFEPDEVGSGPERYWHWYVRPRSADDDLSKTSTAPVQWDTHIGDVVKFARQMVDVLLKDNPELRNAVILAAKFHDLGKKREQWQRSIGNPNPTDWHAKSGKRWIPLDICPDYRHEFGSLLDILDPNQEYKAELEHLSHEMQDVVLHLIAAHHGYARPHFPPEKAYDTNTDHPDSEANKVAVEIIQRFARLQRKYGRWGLAYLESLLRAADYAVSSNPQNGVTENPEEES